MTVDPTDPAVMDRGALEREVTWWRDLVRRMLHADGWHGRFDAFENHDTRHKMAAWIEIIDHECRRAATAHALHPRAHRPHTGEPTRPGGEPMTAARHIEPAPCAHCFGDHPSEAHSDPAIARSVKRRYEDAGNDTEAALWVAVIRKLERDNG